MKGRSTIKVYDLDSFRQAIKKMGFEEFWNSFIKTYLYKKRPDIQSKPASDLELDMRSSILEFDNIGELYEIGLECDNQISKKELGQYYTPKDVCSFMASKTLSLLDVVHDALADVCCGTGNLVIEVLNQIDKDDVQRILRDGRLYLYDLDKTAMRLAIMKIVILFVSKYDKNSYMQIVNNINCSVGNFLDDSVSLPENCVIISNPPYGKIPDKMLVWKECESLATNDMYAVFIEKMAKQSKGAVIISPQSFLGGSKFSTIREVLSNFGGYIYSFDNIPCPIFIGRKKGIFNTNKMNSVRAAITVINNKSKGFRVSPMIRFNASEREEMFKQLDNLLGNFVYIGSNPWTKIPKTLEPVVKSLKCATETVNDLIQKNAKKQEKRFQITIPSTPRYFITGSRRELSRSSKIVIYARDRESFDRLYVMINSTFSYLWWRIYDGGITLSRQTLLSMPVPNMSAEEMKAIVAEGVNMEGDYIVNKVNAGKNNENVKFPDDYRRKVNGFILDKLGFDDMDNVLFSIHSNNLTTVLPLWR